MKGSGQAQTQVENMTLVCPLPRSIKTPVVANRTRGFGRGEAISLRGDFFLSFVTKDIKVPNDFRKDSRGS